MLPNTCPALIDFLFSGQRSCEYDVNIGGANEDLQYVGTMSSGKECQVACQGNGDCKFFVWGGPNAAYGCWLKQLKGQSFDAIGRRLLDEAVSGLADCFLPSGIPFHLSGF